MRHLLPFQRKFTLEDGAILLNGSKAWSLKCNQLNKVIDTADNYSVRTIGVYAALLQMLKNNGAYSTANKQREALSVIDNCFKLLNENSFNLSALISFKTSAISAFEIALVAKEALKSKYSSKELYFTQSDMVK